MERQRSLVEVEKEAIEKVEGSGDIHKSICMVKSDPCANYGSKKVKMCTFNFCCEDFGLFFVKLFKIYMFWQFWQMIPSALL